MATVDGNPSPPSRSSPTTIGRIAVVVIILGSALLWIYALTRTPGRPPGSLDDPGFATSAEPVCAAAQAELSQLPPAYSASDPAARAATVSAATDRLERMLNQLQATTPPPGTRDGDMVAEWLNDWRVYLDDRRNYADRLLAEGDVRFYVTEKEGRQITAPIDRFAQVNHMPSCATPGDLG
ncbi:MAG: hypothetical protein WHS89_13460 [Acidimicrobiales bacterium]